MPGISATAEDTAPPPSAERSATSEIRANPVRLALAGGTSPEALRRVNTYLGGMQATHGVGFGIVRNGPGVPAEIVLHTGFNPGAAGKVVEELRARNLITESEKTAKLQQLGGSLQDKVSAPGIPEPDPGQFSVNGHRYRLDMRESEARTADALHVAEVVPLDKVSPQELIADTHKVRGLLSRGLPEGSLTDVKDVSEGYVFHDNGDVRAQGANQFYIRSELSPASVLESLPRESPAAAMPRAQRITKAEGFSVSVGGTVIASEEARGRYRSANGYSLEDAVRVMTRQGQLTGYDADGHSASPAGHQETRPEVSIRTDSDALMEGAGVPRSQPLPGAGLADTSSTFHVVDAKTSVAMTRAAMLRQALYAARNLMDGNLEGAAQNAGGVGMAVGMEAMNRQAGKLMEDMANRQARMVAEGMSREAAELAAKEGSGRIVRMMASTVEVGGKKVPLLGAVVSAGFGAYEIYTTVADDKASWTKVATTSGAVLGETAGSFFGFGAAEAGREAVVVGTGLVVDDRNRARDSSTVEFAKELKHAYTEAREWDADQVKALYQGNLEASKNNRAAERLAALGVQTGKGALSDAADGTQREGQLAKLEWGALEAQGPVADIPMTPDNVRKLTMDAAKLQTSAALHPETNTVPIFVVNVSRMQDGSVTSSEADLPEGVRAMFQQHSDYRYVNMPLYHAEALDATGALKPDAQPFALRRYVAPEPESTRNMQVAALFTPAQRSADTQIRR